MSVFKKIIADLPMTLIMVLILLTLLLPFMFFGYGVVAADDTLGNVKQAVIQLAIKTETGKGSCSASQISYHGNLYILTARHCVLHESKVKDGNTGNGVEIALLLPNNAVIVTSPINWKISRSSDLAFLPLAHALLPKYVSISRNAPKTGDILTTLGFPMGIAEIFTASGELKDTLIPWDESFGRFINFMVIGGHSGGIVINAVGEGVGVLVGGTNAIYPIAIIIPYSQLIAELNILD